MPRMKDYTKNTGFGSGDDRLKIDNDGTLTLHGDATTWDDILGPVSGVKLHDTKGTVTYDMSEASLVFEPSGDISDDTDCVCWNVQKEHRIKEDSLMYMHIHFEQTSAIVPTFTLQYRIQQNNTAKTIAWTTITNSEGEVFPYVSGTLIQITKFPTIDWSTASISSTVQFRMTRTDATAGDVNVTFMDAHVEIDTLGSHSQYEK